MKGRRGYSKHWEISISLKTWIAPPILFPLIIDALDPLTIATLLFLRKITSARLNELACYGLIRVIRIPSSFIIRYESIAIGIRSLKSKILLETVSVIKLVLKTVLSYFSVTFGALGINEPIMISLWPCRTITIPSRRRTVTFWLNLCPIEKFSILSNPLQRTKAQGLMVWTLSFISIIRTSSRDPSSKPFPELLGPNLYCVDPKIW